ncbi:unnamed protein product [Meganyctiphanes norvegica]|uniref:Uncharacterized protein n=1 Tax=Meganyctiphanes norvegica TaxID=48144 RepID=A0AAV2RB55_MEGNR
MGHPHAEHFEEGFKVVAKSQRLRGGSVDVSQAQLVYEGTIPPKHNPVNNEVLIAPNTKPVLHEVGILQNQEVPTPSYVPAEVITQINQTPDSHEVKTITWNGHIFDDKIVPQGQAQYIYDVIAPTKENEIIPDSSFSNQRIIEDTQLSHKQYAEDQKEDINIVSSSSNKALAKEQHTKEQEASTVHFPVQDKQNQEQIIDSETSNPDDLLIFIDEPISVEDSDNLYDPFVYNGDEYVSIEEHFGEEGNLRPLSDNSEKYTITTYRPNNAKKFQSFGKFNESSTMSKHKEKLMKLMDKPKKFMKVIKTLGAGHYVPSSVPGIMVAVEDGSGEAFVPEDIIRSSDYILEAAASENLLSFAVPEDQLAVESTSNQQKRQISVAARAPVPMKGMPYNFGWIVDDEATANYQTRQETANNEGVVMGCYQVLEPTGLVRTVTYIADDGGFRVLNLTNGPDKTPCPGIEEAGRLAANSAKSFNRPPPPPRTRPPAQGLVANNNFQSSFSQSSSNYSSSNYSSNSFNSVNNAIVFEPSTTTYVPPPPPTTTTPRPTPPARVPITTATPTEAAASYSLAGSAQQAWMTEYLQNITQHLYNSFTNSSTQTNYFGGGAQGLINFPFVMIPITTFLELQRKGAIDSNTQTYGAFIQPQLSAGFAKALPSQVVQPQQQQQQAQKVVQKTTTNVYNTKQTKVNQVKQRQEGVNTVNYQINGVHGQTPKVSQQVASQFKSSQSTNESKQSSSSNSINTSSNVNYNVGGGRNLAQQNYQSSQASQAAKSSSSSSNSRKQFNNVGQGRASNQYSQQQNSQASQAAKSSSSSSNSRKQYSNVGQGRASNQYSQQQSSQASQAAKSSSSSSNNRKQYSNVGQGRASNQYSQQQSSQQSQSNKSSSSSNSVQSNFAGSNAHSAFRQPVYATPFTVRPSKRPTPLPNTIRQPVVSSIRPNYNVLPKQLAQTNNDQRGQQKIQNTFQSHMSSQSSQAQNSKNSNNIIVNNNGNHQISQAYQSQQASKESKAQSSSSKSSNIASINYGRQQLSQNQSQQKSSQSGSSSSSSSSFNRFQSNQARANTVKFPKQLSSSVNTIPHAVQPTPAFGTRIPARKPITTRKPIISPRPGNRFVLVSKSSTTTRRPAIPPRPTTNRLRSSKPKPTTFSSVSFNVPTPVKTSQARIPKSGSFSSQSSKSSQNEQSAKSNSNVQSHISSAGASYIAQNSSSSNAKSSDSNKQSSQYISNDGNSNIQQASSSASMSSSSSSSSSHSSNQQFSGAAGANFQNIPSNIHQVIPTVSFSTPAAVTSKAPTYNQPIPRKAPQTPTPPRVEEFIAPVAEPIFSKSEPVFSRKNMAGWTPMTSKPYYNQPKSLQQASLNSNIGNQFQASSSSSKSSNQSSSSNQSQHFSGSWAGPATATSGNQPHAQSPQYNANPASQNLGAGSSLSSSSSSSSSSSQQSSNSQSSQQYSGAWNGDGASPQSSIAASFSPQVPQFPDPVNPQFEAPAFPQFHTQHIPQFETLGVPNTFQTYDDPQTQVRTWNSQNYGR